MSISDTDITIPNVMDFVNPPKYVPTKSSRTHWAKEARLTLRNCPDCGYRAVEETLTVRRPGQPVVRRVLLRCWRNATTDHPKCPVLVIEETPLEEEDDFPYSSYKTEKKKPRRVDPPRTPVLIPLEDKHQTTTKPTKDVKHRFCVDCSTDITKFNHNAVRCVACRQEYKRSRGRERYRRERGPSDARACDTCGKILRGGQRQVTCACCAQVARTRAREEAKKASRKAKGGSDPRAERTCMDCGLDISHRIKTCVRCVDCADKHRRMMVPIWDKELRARKKKLTVNP